MPLAKVVINKENFYNAIKSVPETRALDLMVSAPVFINHFGARLSKIFSLSSRNSIMKLSS
jgi:hypothetical protein